MTALDQTKFLGYRYLEFDNRFAPPSPTGVPPAAGLNPCLIPAPGVPGTIYDMRDVVWVDRLIGSAGATMTVEIQDGAKIRNLKKIEMVILDLIYNGLTPNNWPIVMSTYDGANGPPGTSLGLTIFSKRTRLYNTIAGAQPMILFDLGAGKLCFIDFDNNAALGNGVLPAPVVELVAGQTAIMISVSATQIFNNAFKGPVGSTIQFLMEAAGTFGQPSNTQQTFSFPAYAGALQVNNIVLSQRWAPSPVAVGAVTALHGQVQQVNAIGGPITVTLPLSKVAAPTTGTFGYAGSAVTVQEVGGGANPITVTAQPGETINGAALFVMPAAAYASQRFWADGLGAWFASA